MKLLESKECLETSTNEVRFGRAFLLLLLMVDIYFVWRRSGWNLGYETEGACFYFSRKYLSEVIRETKQ